MEVICDDRFDLAIGLALLILGDVPCILVRSHLLGLPGDYIQLDANSDNTMVASITELLD